VQEGEQSPYVAAVEGPDLRVFTFLPDVRIPRESCHPFHTKVATDSTQNLPLIP
jgi:hypothetical protein